MTGTVNQVDNALKGSTGTGNFVGADTPTLITPNIGAATGTSLSVSGAIASTASSVTAATTLNVGTNIFLSQTAGGARYVALTGEAGNTGQLNFQAGEGSATFGGAMSLYGNSHATKPGYVNIGLSSNAATPKFFITDNPFGNGTEVFSVNNVGKTICAGSLTTSQTAGIIGTTTNNNANAGSVGEFVSSVVTAASPGSIGSGLPANIATLSLTAGDWEVWGNVGYYDTTGTALYTQLAGNVTATSASLSAGELRTSFAYNNYLLPAYTVFPVMPLRVSLATTTTIYMVGYAVFTGVSTVQFFGGIYARRIR